MYTHKYIYMYIHVYIYIYTHTHIYIHEFLRPIPPPPSRQDLRASLAPPFGLAPLLTHAVRCVSFMGRVNLMRTHLVGL